MKNKLRFSLLSLFLICSLFLYSQENCKVLKSSISGTYQGKCKKGLANGKGVAVGTDRYEGQFVNGLPNGYGTYTWANGDKYTGEWIEGMRHGIGRYTMTISGIDSVQDGLWQNDEYSGPKPKNPFVIYKSGVDRYTFRKNLSTQNRVLVDINQNGIRNTGISNFLISTSSGSETKLGESLGYEYVTFPVTIKISYTTFNKLRTISYPVLFEFEIYEPGDWKVELSN